MSINDIFKNRFSSYKIESLKEASKLMESLLDSMGTNNEEAKIEMDNKDMQGWMVKVGSAYIFIYILKSDDLKMYFKVLSPVCFMPEKNIIPFYRFLLETNMFIGGYALGVEKNIVMLQSLKRLDNLELEDAKKAIEQIAKLSGEISIKSVDEFKARYYELE